MRINISNTTVIGSLARDVEVAERAGKKVANFTVAVARDYKNADGNRESDFYRCEIWGPAAEFIGTGKKGQPMGVVGRFESRVDAQTDGKRVTYWTLKARTAQLGDVVVKGEDEPDGADPFVTDGDTPFPYA